MRQSLTLRRETVRTLTDHALARVGGGTDRFSLGWVPASSFNTCTLHCDATWNCGDCNAPSCVCPKELE